MMNQELDKMLKHGAAETGPLHNAKNTRYHLRTRRGTQTAPPREAEGRAGKAAGVQEDATQHSVAEAPEVVAEARRYMVNGTTAHNA